MEGGGERDLDRGCRGSSMGVGGWGLGLGVGGWGLWFGVWSLEVQASFLKVMVSV